MVMEILLDNLDQSSVTGYVVLQDMNGVTMSHMSSFSPSMAKKMMTVVQVSKKITYKLN